jgi:hypothetical protein
MGDVMKKLRVSLALCAGIAAIAPTAASAEPPASPPGCNVVLTTPAATTGSSQGQANKVATFQRVCLS